MNALEVPVVGIALRLLADAILVLGFMFCFSYGASALKDGFERLCEPGERLVGAALTGAGLVALSFACALFIVALVDLWGVWLRCWSIVVPG